MFASYTTLLSEINKGEHWRKKGIVYDMVFQLYKSSINKTEQYNGCFKIENQADTLNYIEQNVLLK